MKKLLILLILSLVGIIIVSLLMFFENVNNNDLFYGLEPKATYKEYKIYDIVEQRQLACAEMIEILIEDDQYTYYFNCLKSDQIYLVSKDEIIKVKNAYNANIISKETLYELDIIDRMEKAYE